MTAITATARDLKDAIIQLSDNFRLHEFYVSKTYPQLAERMYVNLQDVASLTRLCSLIIQPIRDYVGHSIAINSGKRDTVLNDAVGGSKTSQHFLAEAADLNLRGSEAWNVYMWAMTNLKDVIGQMIIYLDREGNPEFIHVSTKSLRGSSKAQGDFRVKESGNKKYIPYSEWTRS